VLPRDLKKKRRAGSSEKTMRFQFDNWRNSKERPAFRAAVGAVLAGSLALAVLILAAAAQLAPPLSGRLHPAIVPIALGCLALVSALMAGAALLLRGGGSPDGCLPASAVPERSIAAAVAALVVIAFGVRLMGVIPTGFVAAAIAASGVAGVSLARAALIAAALSVGAAAVFVLGLRQPWPLWPPALFGH
jgi:hypothetical protein